MGALLGEPQPGDADAAGGGQGAGDRGQGVGSGDRVVAESLDAQQAPVGGVADLPQCGQIGQSFPDPEIAGVVDGGFGAQGFSFLVVLLDGGVLVVDVQARDDPGGDNPGPEPSRCRAGSAPPQLAVEDEADPVGAADIEIVAG